MKKFKVLGVLVALLSYGCLPKPQFPMGDSIYRNGSNITSIDVSLPESELEKITKVELNFFQVDKDGVLVDGGVDFQVDLVVSGTKLLNDTVKVNSANYKVAMSLYNGEETFASTTLCVSDLHKDKNNAVQEIFGESYSLKLYLCKPSGEKAVETDDSKTDVSITPEIVESDEMTMAVDVDSLEVGTTYRVILTQSTMLVGYEDDEKKCLLSEGDEFIGTLTGRMHSDVHLMFEISDQAKLSCPAKGHLGKYTVKTYK